MDDVKTCARCGKAKLLSEFHSDASRKDGLHHWCKACAKERYRKYYEAHREKILEQNREYHKAHREKENERRHKYYRTHHEEKLEKQREHYEANKEKYFAKTAKRRALKRSATTGDKAAITAIYDLAKNGDDVRCYLCGELISKGDRHVDHIVPLSKGGDHTVLNLAIACSTCNLRKHDKMPQEIGLLL